MSSEGLPVNGVVSTDIVLGARSTQQATDEAKSSLSADSAAQSADAAFKFSKESEQHSNHSSAFADKSAASAASAKVSEKNAEATLASAVKKGDYGVGGSSKGFMARTSSDLMKACKERGGGFVRNNTGTAGVPTYGAGVYARSEDTNTLIVANYLDANLFVLACSDNSINDVKINRIWGSVNTTVDSNGFIKKASPIARLSSAPEKMADDYLNGFTLAGYVAVNSEADGVSAERVSVGVYKVTGSLGFAAEGWNIEVPQDVNGNRLCFVETSIGKDGTIYVKVSKRRFDIDTAAIVAGDPMDIPDGRWIDLRLEMPMREVVEDPLPLEPAQPPEE